MVKKVRKLIIKMSWRNVMKDLNSRLENEEASLGACREILDYYKDHPQEQEQDEEQIALYNYWKIKSQNTVTRLKELKEKMEVEVA